MVAAPLGRRDLVCFLSRFRSISLVAPAGAGADTREIGFVDMNRDGGYVGKGGYAGDVATRREAADVADLVFIGGEQVQVGVEPLLVLAVRRLLDQYEELWRGRVDRMTALISETKARANDRYRRPQGSTGAHDDNRS